MEGYGLAGDEKDVMCACQDSESSKKLRCEGVEGMRSGFLCESGVHYTYLTTWVCVVISQDQGV